ncbi:LCP family protein [Streptomyces sp. TLI_146]|uniref:LCP family protein n=1 Tax=Streptomyces sp. TLI_146 TaxID=1938858 RepID=UPI000C71138E|nr:LCP family protein [Streptomyces sp. TLI_146]PKV85697.1 LytR family transcriptional attenuator [Streptomyces sp. TLI_146]
MNDRQDPYDPYAPQVQLVGYDEYGQPVYQQVPQQASYDPYAQAQPQQPHQSQQTQPSQQDHQGQQGQQQGGYGYDPYAQQQPSYDYTYDTYGQSAQPSVPQQNQGYGYDTAQQWGREQPPAQASPAQAPVREPEPEPVAEQIPVLPQQRKDERDYRTEQFSFIEEPDEDSEDVIDWLKFTESRSERREEARRRGRNRVVALVVVLALAAVGGVGYLWAAGKLPGLSSSSDSKKPGVAVGAQKRDVIVVHLHNTAKGGTSTALLVNNATTKQGTTVLLPNTLAVSNDDGTRTTLGKSVDSDGSQGTREALGALLGTKITGTWRLDTPFLQNLVDLVGNIDISTDADVPGAKADAAPVVKKGDDQTLTGQMAVAYATYKAPGEADAKQLQRFGQVMYGVLRKISDDPKAATITVQTLAQILDPSLPESDLGASLAKLAEHAKVGAYKTALLPVQPDGTLSAQAGDSVVKDILGGSVTAPDKGAAVRVGVSNASGNPKAADKARVDLVNGGYAVIDAGGASTAASSSVTYGDTGQKAKAEEVAKTLGLPAGAVKQGKAAANADVTVVLGKDYKIK